MLTRTGQLYANACSAFYNTRSNLDQMEPERCELGAKQKRAPERGFAYGEHEPIGGGVQDQTERLRADSGTRYDLRRVGSCAV